MKSFKRIMGICLTLVLLTGCVEFNQLAKKTAGGLAEIISGAVAGVVETSLKVVFLSVLDVQQSGAKLVAFEAETLSGKTFKGVALGATNALESGELSINGKAFSVQGEAVLLANGMTKKGNSPLVLIAVENDTQITDPSDSKTLKDTGTLDLIAESLAQGKDSPTVFRYIGETEKNIKLIGIGVSRANIPEKKQTSYMWRSSTEFRFEGSPIETAVGSLVKANAEIRASIALEQQTLESVIYALKINAQD